MYKKITHTIVEEHFDHPLATEITDEIKATFKAPLRYYTNGGQIPSDLPESYQQATSLTQRCANCLAYDAPYAVCKKWQLPVRTEYVCAAWTPV